MKTIASAAPATRANAPHAKSSKSSRRTSALPLVLGLLPAASLSVSLFSATTADAQTTTFSAGVAPADATAAPAPAPIAPLGAAPAAAPVAAGTVDVLPIVPESDEEARWKARDRSIMESDALNGGVGLLHMQHAQSGAPGQFRLGFNSEFFSAGFLCSTTYPCPNTTAGKPPITSDTMNHVGATVSLSATLASFLEAYVSTGAYANSDSANKPSLLQVLGDTNLGLKAFYGINKVFYIGAATELDLVNGTGAVGLNGSGTGGKFRLLATTDLRGMDKHVPLRFSINGTYSLDNTGQVVASTETALGNSITRIERFGLEINRVDHFDINLGAETFLVDEHIRPFVEYGMLIPINRQNYECKPFNQSADQCLANDKVAPSKLTIGARFLPWKRGFSLLAAMDIGVTGTGNFIEEVAPVAPWTLYIGGGWAIDTQDRPPVEKVKLVEKTLEAPVGHVKGFVHELNSDHGVPNAIVAYDNHPEFTSMATGADGRFSTQGLLVGGYKFNVRADGFKDGVCETQLTTAGQDVQLDCPLESLPKMGTVVGHVTDAETHAPVANASIKINDAGGKELRYSTDARGAFKFDSVTPGAITVAADAEGYLALVTTAQVKARAETDVELSGVKKPKTALVEVTAGEIRIKEQIRFAVDSATILPDSFALMSEIADTLLRNPRIRRVEIQGHTDNSGTADHNKTLSDERANSVRDWLTSHGVASGRLTAQGYGQERPLVPNVTAAMRARNRRVQFKITEQDATSSLSPSH
jgi:outer membrane protein OmpA-like peptidoglycan-associated protein